MDDIDASAQHSCRFTVAVPAAPIVCLPTSGIRRCAAQGAFPVPGVRNTSTDQVSVAYAVQQFQMLERSQLQLYDNCEALVRHFRIKSDVTLSDHTVRYVNDHPWSRSVPALPMHGCLVRLSNSTPSHWSILPQQCMALQLLPVNLLAAPAHSL